MIYNSRLTPFWYDAADKERVKQERLRAEMRSICIEIDRLETLGAVTLKRSQKSELAALKADRQSLEARGIERPRERVTNRAAFGEVGTLMHGSLGDGNRWVSRRG